MLPFAVICLITSKKPTAGEASFLPKRRVKVAFSAAASIGLPLGNFNPGLIWNVYVRPPFEIFGRLAMPPITTLPALPCASGNVSSGVHVASESFHVEAKYQSPGSR